MSRWWRGFGIERKISPQLLRVLLGGSLEPLNRRPHCRLLTRRQALDLLLKLLPSIGAATRSLLSIALAEIVRDFRAPATDELENVTTECAHLLKVLVLDKPGAIGFLY